MYSDGRWSAVSCVFLRFWWKVANERGMESKRALLLREAASRKTTLCGRSTGRRRREMEWNSNCDANQMKSHFSWRIVLVLSLIAVITFSSPSLARAVSNSNGGNEQPHNTTARPSGGAMSIGITQTLPHIRAPKRKKARGTWARCRCAFFAARFKCRTMRIHICVFGYFVVGSVSIC